MLPFLYIVIVSSYKPGIRRVIVTSMEIFKMLPFLYKVIVSSYKPGIRRVIVTSMEIFKVLPRKICYFWWISSRYNPIGMTW